MIVDLAQSGLLVTVFSLTSVFLDCREVVSFRQIALRDPAENSFVLNLKGFSQPFRFVEGLPEPLKS